MRLPVQCPACDKTLKVSKLKCESCDTEVSGMYALPKLMSLPEDDLEFILEFVKSGGSLKKMSAQMNRSYPVVRNTLDGIIDKLNQK